MSTLFNKLLRWVHRRFFGSVLREQNRLLLLTGNQQARLVSTDTYESIQQAEFRVYSQFGDDGIIQYLIHRIPLQRKTFVEFGVQDYAESNTRFLLVNNHWDGLVMDGGTDHLRFIHEQELDWRTSVRARSVFITRDNINRLFEEERVTGDIGLLSIDIDGNDYWVWQALSVSNPRIVIAEYNSVFGDTAAVSIPYQEDFVRSRAHFSHLYWGASLAALCQCADQKGYVFIGCNSAGNNAYFIRKDVAQGFRALTPQQGYVASSFRESRDEMGRLSYLTSMSERRAVMAALPLVDVRTGQTVRVSDLERKSG